MISVTCVIESGCTVIRALASKQDTMSSNPSQVDCFHCIQLNSGPPNPNTTWPLQPGKVKNGLV